MSQSPRFAMFAAGIAAATLTSASLAQTAGGSAPAPSDATAGGLFSTLKAVVPGASISSEGDSFEGTALGAFSNTAQAVYSEALLRTGGIRPGDVIDGLSFRVNVAPNAGVAPIFSVEQYQIRMGSSVNPPQALDPDFALNRGSDYLVVRSGPLEYDGSEYPAGGPYNGFGPEIPFSESFTYLGGPLLLEYTHSEIPSTNSRADALNVSAELGSIQFAPGFDGTIEGFGGPQFGMPVVRFSVRRDATGACFLDGSCFEATFLECAAVGGSFQGDGTICETAGIPNNLVCNAAAIGEGDTDFDTTEATVTELALPESCDEGSGLGFSRDLWYRFTPIESGTLVVSTCNQADYDTRLAAYTGLCSGDLELIGCNDDGAGCSGFSSEMVLEVTEGVDVLIRVGGFASSGGPESFGQGTLSVTLSPCPFDSDGSGTVDFQDLLGLLGAFGPCP